MAQENNVFNLMINAKILSDLHSATLKIYSIALTLFIGASLSKPHTSESPPQILVLSTMHKKLQQKSDNLRVRQEFNGVDYSTSLCGSCNHNSVDYRVWCYCSCHNK